MRNIAIIPARSGSKGLIDKNIKLFNGLPLLVYSIRAAQNSGLFDEVMVSTDSLEYAHIAKDYGAEVPFIRSEENSGDKAGSWEVVKEVLYLYQVKGVMFDTVCLLQPTSPLRTEDDIIAGYKLLFLKQADAITSVCEMDHSPIWTMPLPADHSLKDFRKNCNFAPRQKLETYFRINGALYIRRLSYDENSIKILNEEEYALIMDRRKSIDIDTKIDFEIAEYIYRKRIEGEYDE